MEGLLMGVVSSLIATAIIAAVRALFGHRSSTPARMEQVEVERETVRTTFKVPGFYRRECETETTRIRQTN